LLALTSAPQPTGSNAALRAAFDSGLPAMLWRRADCDGGCASGRDACGGDGFQACVTDRFADPDDRLPAARLPELVRRMRQEAAESPDGAGHGRSVTLVWEPAELRHAPVPLRMA
jgi:hypothetical protein